MDSGSYIELSRSALVNNLQFIQNILGPATSISSVVKGNAYGHGIEEIVPEITNAGIKHFCVFNADEAFRVYKSSEGKASVCIMGFAGADALEWAVNCGVELFVFDVERLDHLLKIAQGVSKKANIHLELETGLNRTGLQGDSLKKSIDIIKGNPSCFNIVGLCSHLAGSESIANYRRIQSQKRSFKELTAKLDRRFQTPTAKHLACSAAAIRYPESRYNMVRIGIMQYGFWPSPETFIHYSLKYKTKDNPLQQVISWKSRVMAVKHVKAGEYVGYGTSYMAHEKMRIAVVPVGYGYGFGRNLSNKGRVLIRGKRLPVVGLVNMNVLMVDVSELSEVLIRDEVVLIGRQGDQFLSVSSFGEFSDQLNYELLTRLPANLPRIIKD